LNFSKIKVGFQLKKKILIFKYLTTFSPLFNLFKTPSTIPFNVDKIKLKLKINTNDKGKSDKKK
jgi:hypothetical protein